MIKSQRWTKNELTNELPNSVTNLLMEDVSEGRISTIEMRSHLQRCVKTRDCGAPPLFLIMLKHPSWNSSFKSIPWNVFKCIFNFDGGYPVHIRRKFVGYPPSGYHVTNSRINQKWTFVLFIKQNSLLRNFKICK